jgi:MsuE subfamily FMN reductase
VRATYVIYIGFTSRGDKLQSIQRCIKVETILFEEAILKLLGLCGSPSKQSKTLLVLQRAVDDACHADAQLQTEIINLRDRNIDFCRGSDKESYNSDTMAVIRSIVESDAYIVATPIYRGSYTGILKNIFDIIPNDALRGKPVALIGTGGSDHHYLAIEQELKPLMGFFEAIIVPGYTYAKNDDFSVSGIQAQSVLDSLRKMAEAVVSLAKTLPRDSIGAPPPYIARQSLTDLTTDRALGTLA